MTKARQLTYIERTARFPLDFTIDVGSELYQVKVPAAWEQKNLVRLGPYNTSKLTFSPRVNIHAAPVFSAFFETLKGAGLLADILTYDGGFYARLKRGITPPPAGSSKDVWGKQLSNHSRGTALDLNAKWNAMGKPGAEPGHEGSVAKLVTVARQVRVNIETPAGHIWPAGIVCGADWHGPSRDDMHFEIGTFEP